MTANVLASGVYYLPDVTGEMSSPSFWADETDLLMLYDETVKLNTETISTNGTSMYDLKNQPEFVDGINLNERILKSSQEDAKYYLGWTYLGTEEKATAEDYDKMMQNIRGMM